MTDGPFRNAALPSRWKQYGRDLVSDAISHSQRVARVSQNMLADLDPRTFRAIWSDLVIYGELRQLDLDPESSVQSIFEARPVRPSTKILLKHVVANLSRSTSILQSMEQGLLEAAKELLEIGKNRFDEHCLSSRDRGDMLGEDYRKGIVRNRETFHAVDPRALCEALQKGDMSAFKPALQKKLGIDEGPDE